MPRQRGKRVIGADGNAPNSATEDSAANQAIKHNATALDDIRRECATAMSEIIAKRKALNEEAGDIRTRLKDAGINVKGWEHALRMADMEDIAARDSYLDELRMTCEALGVGVQGDFFPAGLDAGAAPKDEHDFDGNGDPRSRQQRQTEAEMAEAAGNA